MAIPKPAIPKPDPRLLPCPFCNGWAYIAQEVRGGCKEGDSGALAFFAACNSCACCGPWSKGSDGGAVRQSNWRHGDAALFLKSVDDEPDTVGRERAAELVAEYGEPAVRPYLRLIEAAVREAKKGIRVRMQALGGPT